MGVRCLSSLNRALLGKWCWCFADEKRTLWKQVISGKYGEEEGGGALVKWERGIEWGY